MSHAIRVTDFYLSFWAVADATNQCPSLKFKFPTTISECQAISSELSAQSKAGFNNCIGCIDGLLIWLEKPSKKECEQVGVDTGKFHCGKKGKFGLNFQGICDVRRRFTYISIQHPVSASDYLSFVTSSLYGHLMNEDTCLPSGYCLYGDNAYVNDMYMAVPYLSTSSGPNDAYNYYHSQVSNDIECIFTNVVNLWWLLKKLLIAQVRIITECAFGLLVNRWRLLKMPLSSKLSIHSINAMVCCLCKLHNNCIDQGSTTSPERYIHDSLTLMDFMQIGENAEAWPLGLLGGGEHFADIDGGQHKA